MKYTKTVEINIDDWVECLTADGWLDGKVTKLTETTITAFMDDLEEEREFEIKFVKF